MLECHKRKNDIKFAVLSEVQEEPINEGYKCNPYEPFVANKIIENKQVKIFFYVDDLKLSHKSRKVAGKIIEWLRQEYESIFRDRYGSMSVR